MGGHGCNNIGNIIGNVTIFEYMGAIWIAWVGTCHAMGGHRSLLMGVVWVWVQIRRKCWALIRSFFVSSERSLPDLNDTLWCVLVVIHNFELDFTFKNIEVSCLLFSFLHCNFLFVFYLFFDNITLCTNLQNVTLSNMSHLVYITLYGETDGVTLSRLDCIYLSI